mmetsp:Transcript_9455/g.13795  ORF Transcript_9455/g.13795 Transcript_9455/m.13795 type:complete len:302 (-) Transcript_9455:365-1270(-)|eukprot:CAMPEP_0184753190 /NCGR_PEP_ID=MMETSP0315-20130426/43972_1 /TAXON_ID=101924 /ORGANISM="Rhodosorus marinus, Strain UTEX LB 2760" /LENGTH=301 /DNA_ID=CAMNT_0027232559 /DNA_START=368 /DNA_END=1273 /DNA_ORIENTATION=+
MDIRTIDLSEGFDEAEAIKSLRLAAQSHGLFFLKALSDEESSKMLEISKDFFALPEEVKREDSIDYTHGYLGPGWQLLDPGHQSRADTKEAFCVGPELEDQAVQPPFYNNNTFPDAHLPEMRGLMTRYKERMFELSKRLNRIIALSFGLPGDYFVHTFEESPAILRMLHYAAEKSDVEQGVLAAGAHTDWGMITLLLTDGQPGLEVEENGEWFDIREPKGTLICNVGDMLRMWSNDMYISPRHRVVNKTGLDRYSIVFFFHPNPKTVVAPLPNCGKPMYPEITCEEHLLSRYRATRRAPPV